MSNPLRRGFRLLLFAMAFTCLGIWTVVTVQSRRFNEVEGQKLEQITRAERPAVQVGQTVKIKQGRM